MTTAIRERPQLFSGAMVRAILDGSKTQTRRAFRMPAGMCWYADLGGEAEGWTCDDPGGGWHHVSELACPHGDVGDRLWVRESYCPDWASKEVYRADDPSGRADWAFLYSSKPRWRPSIHMPRSACRIVLEITEVRIERIQSILIPDIEAEGIREYARSKGLDPSRTSSLALWIDLWDSTNPDEYYWVRNPWTWALTFRRITEGGGL